MITLLSLYIVAASIIGILTGITLATIYARMRPTLFEIEPRKRANIILGWACAPGLIGGLLTFLFLLPTLTIYLGLPVGHCHNHEAQLPHICLLNPLVSEISILPPFLIIPIFLIVSLGMVMGGRSIVKASILARNFRQFGEDKNGVVFLDWNKPIALTVGYFFPQIFISKTLTEALTEEQLKALTVHEREHARHRDPMRLGLACIFSIFSPKRLRAVILTDLELSTEEACDRAAAIAVDSPLFVAETIVVVEKMMQPYSKNQTPAIASFSGNNSSHRIECLLSNQTFKNISIPAWLVIAPLMITTSFILPAPMHFLAELVVGH